MAQALEVRGGHQSLPVLLGYLDSEVVDVSLDYTVSKIGGTPNVPGNVSLSKVRNESRCSICKNDSALICQIYAPLEGSIYHRTLYIFACLNHTCWNNSSSWTCIRVQVADPTYHSGSKVNPEAEVEKMVKKKWFEDEDDWGDEEENDAFEEEENGNIPITSQLRNLNLSQDNYCTQTPSPDLTTTSEDISITSDTNANDQFQGAVAADTGNCNETSDYGTAEIEPDQDDQVIGIEEMPISDPISNSDIPHLFASHNNSRQHDSSQNLDLKSFFISVEEEMSRTPGMSEHERSLLARYKKVEGEAAEFEAKSGKAGNGCDGYEKAIPKHGDIWFHKFISTLNENPGQVLRYTRDANRKPLYVSKPASNANIPSKCSFCSASVICEVQLLPSLVSSLRFSNSSSGSELSTPIEFGTVMIWTCQKSCWTEGGDQLRHEQIWVQAEPI